MRVPPPWNDARSWLENRWGATVSRVGIDGGFSCPNRGPNRSTPGCCFCSEDGNRPPYQNQATDIPGQIRLAKDFLTKRYGTTLFSLYFQAYSSTWAPVETLRKVYLEALAEGPFVDLTVGTRPDCVPGPIVELLKSLKTPERDVWVELGLQSASDATLSRIQRGHDLRSFQGAAARLRSAEVPFTTHIMFGLPGEAKAEFLETVKLAVAEGTSGVKFHDLILVPGTPLYTEWQQGLVLPVDPEAYLDAVASALAILPPEIVVWRVCSDPEDRKTQGQAPGGKWSKNQFLRRLSDEVKSRRLNQGASGVR